MNRGGAAIIPQRKHGAALFCLGEKILGLIVCAVSFVHAAGGIGLD
jgi:hypothetical protein